MKKNYVPITLESFLSESKSITLKRGYGKREPIVVGAKAPLRNQILTFVSESQKVSKVELKRFIAGLNETSKNPIAAANMWIKRNAKFFVTENKNGITYFKLSNIGKRLANRLTPVSISESEKNIRTHLNEQGPKNRFDDFDEDELKVKPGSYDFIDRKKGYARPGIYDLEECEEDEMDEAQKERIKKIIENIKAKRNKKLNEEDDEEKAKDELTFDDLDLEDEEKPKGEDEEKLEPEDEEDKVEITEFIITVDDVDEAIGELSELEVTAEQVVDEEGENIEDQIKVSADDWEALRGWLEEKGVDIEEMFGGEIEVEDEEKPEEDLELGVEGDEEGNLEVDIEGEKGDVEGEEFSLDLEDDLDLEPEEDVEEGITGMEREEKEKTPNLVAGKEVTITIK